ncbi:hypothetical protein LJR225_001601 [Phenylobacterium sp. LjRoot225]|uniref:DUF7662 domain-containing protein n=1 Tax=Phenylobacterium sp. LjRoot225 TaxID=3342285 RepID=UPI003ECE12A5
MSKYDPLSDRLAAHPAEEWRASFSELESVLGFPLPKAARVGRAWWTDDPGKSHSRAWTLHGWSVDDVDHAGERVVFRKGVVAPDEVQPPVMRKAAEAASTRMHVTQTFRVTALAVAGVAAVVGLGAMLARVVMRRR